ncbi:hypothetical protein RF11_09452 [Thelohanellus kitauei]|uniref:Uncharacterized protein n=1 Tax=Thelohanellus kitauei TaxID=669202 RepID=A0A0C2MXB1_THEKT|nr:hypothetical protein RF11_09452 [Thelohanellus kitauei]
MTQSIEDNLSMVNEVPVLVFNDTVPVDEFLQKQVFHTVLMPDSTIESLIYLGDNQDIFNPRIFKILHVAASPNVPDYRFTFILNVLIPGVEKIVTTNQTKS